MAPAPLHLLDLDRLDHINGWMYVDDGELFWGVWIWLIHFSHLA
jgi:hypothetical protein